MNKQLLRSYIIRYDGTQENLARAMGIALSTLNAKINENRTSFTRDEMQFIKERYKLGVKVFNEIFFNE